MVGRREWRAGRPFRPTRVPYWTSLHTWRPQSKIPGGRDDRTARNRSRKAARRKRPRGSNPRPSARSCEGVRAAQEAPELVLATREDAEDDPGALRRYLRTPELCEAQPAAQEKDQEFAERTPELFLATCNDAEDDPGVRGANSLAAPRRSPAPVAQWIRASDCGSEGHRFESCRAYSQCRPLGACIGFLLGR
jgi:hypothetical protein